MDDARLSCEDLLLAAKYLQENETNNVLMLLDPRAYYLLTRPSRHYRITHGKHGLKRPRGRRNT